MTFDNAVGPFTISPNRISIESAMKKELFTSFAVAGLGLAPLVAQENNLAPGRFGLDEAEAEVETKLVSEGTVLPGDAGRQLNVDLGPEETEEERQAKQLAQLPDAVLALKPAQQIEILRLLREAATFIQGIRLQEGLDRLIQIEAISDEIYQTHNLRGAIFTKLRDFDKARAGFRRALELKPGLMEAMFNLAELDFVEGKFAVAEQAFRKLKTDAAGDMQPETAKLVEYKLFLSVLMQSQSEGDAKYKQAMAMLETFDYLDDYPIYYFSKAAVAFKNDEKEEAEDWLATSRRIYKKSVHTIYVDALIELGWVDSL